MEEKKKKALFEGFYGLDEESQDETKELDKADMILRGFKPPITTKSRIVSTNAKGNTSVLQHPKHLLGRTVSTPLQSSISSPVFPVHRTPSSNLSFPSKPESLHQKSETHTFKQKAVVEMKKATKPAPKRKREQSLKVAPESQQVFKGLFFYFYPNNDIAAPRKIRIRKAMEYGAVWTKEWSEDVTHIIVDDDCNYGHLLKHLRVDSLPARIVVANENYPAYCIGNRFLLNPDHPQYEIKGYKKAIQAQAESIPSVASATSLQLKRNKDSFAPQRTPSRTESSGRINISDNHDSLESKHSPQQSSESVIPSVTYDPDALTEAIEEARVTKDLVRRSNSSIS